MEYSAPHTAPMAAQVSSEYPPGVMSRLYFGIFITSFGTPWGPIPNTRRRLCPLSIISAACATDICLEGSGLQVVRTGAPSWGGNPLEGYGNRWKRPFSARSTK